MMLRRNDGWYITKKAKVEAKSGCTFFEPEDIHVLRFGNPEQDFDARPGKLRKREWRI